MEIASKSSLFLSVEMTLWSIFNDADEQGIVGF